MKVTEITESKEIEDPEVEVEEGDEVGAGGKQATMKDDPDDYLKGQKLVGGG